MIVDSITTTITDLNPPMDHNDIIIIPDDQIQFEAEWEAFNSQLATTTVQQINDVGSEINVVIGQINTVSSKINDNRIATENARDVALIATNFRGAWNITDDFGGKSCVHNGFIYLSAVSPNIGHTPPDTDYWAVGISIDEMISRISVTAATYNTNGTLATMTYTGGYKTLYTYSSGNLSTVQYTDTDGTTVLLTETYAYNASGNLSTVTRS